MKIVQLITGSESFGGAEAHLRDLTIGLRTRGHDCSVIVGPPEGLLSKQLQASGVPVLLLPTLKKRMSPIPDAASLLQLVQALLRIQPDLLATHTSKAGFIGRLAAKLVGIPCLFTPHGWSFINRQNGARIPHRLLLEEGALRLGGKIITVCEAERKTALECLKIRHDEIATIHNGLPDCHVSDRRRNGTPVITMVARFDFQKDHATLLRALTTLTHLEWELRLAGTGPLLPAAKLLAEQLGLSSRVHFLHQCSEIPQLLAETDIFALSTNLEAFPISILEAMRAGLPVVSTDTGGVSEAVEEGANGFLIPQRDAARFAEKLALLLTFRDLRLKLGATSRVRFLRQFEWRFMLDQTEALYLEALSGKVLAEKLSATSA